MIKHRVTSCTSRTGNARGAPRSARPRGCPSGHESLSQLAEPGVGGVSGTLLPRLQQRRVQCCHSLSSMEHKIRFGSLTHMQRTISGMAVSPAPIRTLRGSVQCENGAGVLVQHAEAVFIVVFCRASLPDLIERCKPHTSGTCTPWQSGLSADRKGPSPPTFTVILRHLDLRLCCHWPTGTSSQSSCGMQSMCDRQHVHFGMAT